jgi:predicted transcriptional regulator
MRLDEYMEAEGLSHVQFANLCGISARALYRYAKHQRVPRELVMRAIIRATDHKVTPNDFFGL